jgi:hypothetical protein
VSRSIKWNNLYFSIFWSKVCGGGTVNDLEDYSEGLDYEEMPRDKEDCQSLDAIVCLIIIFSQHGIISAYSDTMLNEFKFYDKGYAD